MGKKLRVGVLVSGRGSNLEAILKASRKNLSPFEVVVVISNKKEALALKRAKKYKISAYFVENGPGLEKTIAKIFRKYRVGLICLAGFMKILSKNFVKKFRHKIINIHPALLPSFPGLNAQAKALQAGAKVSGATVHFVDEGCDTGPIILQKAVEIRDKDSVESLKARILKVEHQIYPQAVKRIANQGLKIVGRRVLKK